MVATRRSGAATPDRTPGTERRRSASSSRKSSTPVVDETAENWSPPPGPAPLVVRTLVELRDDGIPKFIDKPHNILMLLAMLSFWAYTGFQGSSTQSNVKTGLLSGIAGVLLFATLHFRDGYLWRPHPSFWRFVLGVSLLYAVLLSFILQQNKEDVREWLKHIDNRLGVPLPERDYAENCALLTPNHPNGPFAYLWAALNDEFVLAHFLGWYGKALLLRDNTLLWLLSITFEFIELTFEFLFPNFAECWWDHIILDILVCNGLGIYLGIRTYRYLERRELRKSAVRERESAEREREREREREKTEEERKRSRTPGRVALSVMRRAAVQFTPAEWTTYHWEPTKNLRRFLWVSALILFFNIADLNSFFLKYLLWIPPPHPLNAIRLVIWMFMSIPAIREYYQLVTDHHCWRLGTQGWVALAIMFQEVLIIVKFSAGEFTNAIVPAFTLQFWGSCFIALSLWVIKRFIITRKY